MGDFILSLVILILIIPFVLMTRVLNRYSAGSDTRTALVRSEYVPMDVIKEALSGWTIVDSARSGVDFIYLDGTYLQDGAMNSLHAKLKPRLSARVLFDKAELHAALAGTDYICETRAVTAGDTIPDGTVWILRANYGWGGSANAVVSSQDEFKREYARIWELRHAARMRGVAKIIASRYITDPMLYNGYKFHLRLFVIVLVSEESKCAWIQNHGFIVRAEAPYRAGDWGNAAIHDTHVHGDTSLSEGQYPADLPAPNVAGVNTMLSAVFTHLLPRVDKYPESPAAYDIYGVDVMLEADGTPRLIEINRFPGPTLGPERFHSLMATAFAAVFGSADVDASMVTRLV